MKITKQYLKKLIIEAISKQKTRKELNEIALKASIVFFDEIIKLCPELKSGNLKSKDLDEWNKATQKIVAAYYTQNFK